MEVPDIQTFLEMGFAAGVAAFLIRWVTRLVDNHLTHLTNTTEKLVSVVERMGDSLAALVEELRRRP